MHSNIKKRSLKGLTILELMIVITILGVVASFAAPSFQRSIRKQNIASVSQNFANIFALARSSALSRGVTVSICYVPTPADTFPVTCSSGEELFDSDLIPAGDNAGEIILFENPIQSTDGPPTARELIHVFEVKELKLSKVKYLAETDLTSVSMINFSRRGRLIDITQSAVPSFTYEFSLVSTNLSSGPKRELELEATGRVATKEKY